MKDPVMQTIETYNRTAKEYTENTKGLSRPKEQDKFVNYFASKKKILDLGCASGRDSLFFYNKQLIVTGIDLSEKLLDIAKKHAPNCKFLKMDFRKLKFKKETYDGVWASSSLLHIPKNQIIAVLGQLYKILKNEGILYISVKMGSSEELKPDIRYDKNAIKFYSYYQPSELKSYISNAGFKILSIKISKLKTKYLRHKEIRIFAQK